MSASQAPALTAIAFQLLAALETYERDVAVMLKAPLDPEAYRRVSKHIDTMRMYAAELPVLSVAWVEVMIRHFELTHGLWRVQHAPEAADLPQLHAQLREAARRLAQKCVQLLSTN
jgi:hypothetical protein